MSKKGKRIAITREDILKIERAIRREEFIEEGAYNGKLGGRIFTDRKKEQSRRACRGRVTDDI